MKFSKRFSYALFLLLLFITLALRYPTFSHEAGSDSFSNHILADTITKYGYAKWLIHPASAFGIYPFSVETGGLYIISGVSQLTGIDMEHTILIVTILLGLLGTFSIFLLAKKIFDNFFFAFATAFIFSTSRQFIAWTNWNYTTRGFFIAVIPLFVWLILCVGGEKKQKLIYISLAILFFVILGTIHQLIIIVPILVIAYAATYIILRIKTRCMFLKKPSKTKIANISYFSLFTFLLVSPLLGLSFWKPSVEEYMYGPFATIQNFPWYINALVNLFINYSMALGVLSPLIAIGIIFLLSKSNRSFSQSFMLIVLLLYTPFLFDHRYVKCFMVPFFSIFIGLGIFQLSELSMKTKFKKLSNLVIPVSLVILLIAATIPYCVTIQYTTKYSEKELEQFDDKIYSTATYIRAQNTSYGIFVSGVWPSIEYRKVKAYSGIPSWMCGPDILIYDIDKKYNIHVEIDNNFTLNHLILKKGNIWWVQDWYLEGGYFPTFHELMLTMMNVDSLKARQMLNDYDTRYVMLSNPPVRNVFSNSVGIGKYKIYDNGVELIYWI